MIIHNDVFSNNTFSRFFYHYRLGHAALSSVSHARNGTRTRISWAPSILKLLYFFDSLFFLASLFVSHIAGRRRDPENLVLENLASHYDTSVSQLPPKSWGIACWVAELNAVIYLVTKPRAGKNITIISIISLLITPLTCKLPYLCEITDWNYYTNCYFYVQS